MNVRSSLALLLFGLVLASSSVQSKGADGLVSLKGTIHHALVSPESVTFQFSGHLAFSFFTAPLGNSERKQVDLEFDVRKLPIEIPKFDSGPYSNDASPYRVNFRNAGKHATEAAKSGEPVSVSLVSPTLTYDVSGTIVRVSCTHAQVMPESVERALRGQQPQ
jgi:hypothetical protein